MDEHCAYTIWIMGDPTPCEDDTVPGSIYCNLHRDVEDEGCDADDDERFRDDYEL